MSLLRLMTMMRGASLAPVFRSSTGLVGNNNSAARPSGIAVGDLVVVIRLYSLGGATGTLTTSGGSAWTKAAAGAASEGADTYYKILNATDVANSWDFGAGNGGSVLSLAFTANGATALTLKDTRTGSGSPTVTSPGYTASGAARGLLTVAIAPTPAGLTNPAGSTNLASLAATQLTTYVAQNGVYRSGSVTWAGFPSGTDQVIWLFETT